MNEYNYILLLAKISAASILPVFVCALALAFNKYNSAGRVFCFLIMLSFASEFTGWVLFLYKVNNITFYSWYTAAEFTAYTYILLDYAGIAKRYSMPVLVLPVTISIIYFNSFFTLSQIEFSILLVLSMFAGLAMCINRDNNVTRISIIIGIVLYCFNYGLYSYSLSSIEVYSYLNITTNLLFTGGMVAEWIRLIRLRRLAIL